MEAENASIFSKVLYMENKDLYDRLSELAAGDNVPLHMPGHKRNTDIFSMSNPYGIDITEIDGFDNLHNADGIIKEDFKRAAKLFGADETLFLVNGSSAGNMAAICGASKKGDTVIVARNVHCSVNNALFLNELNPVYIYPEIDEIGICTGITRESVRAALEEHPEACEGIITSPTYEGVVSDIKGIAEETHRFGAVLIVDEAHGAHFGFHSYFPQNANTRGADVVIHSLHKTLPSLTQTALLHINGRYAGRERIRNYLHMLQSSSPSYILMASIDECVRGMDECREEIMDTYVECLQQTRERLKQLKNIKLIEAEHFDQSKIVLSVKNLKNTDGEVLNGKRFQEMLRSYHLEMEMASGSYVIAMTGPGDTQEGMDRLVQAVMEIDKNILCEELSGNDEDHTIKNISYEMIPLEQAYSSFEAGRMEGESVKWNEASGRISLEYVYLYPPGIPMIVPGERITSTIVQKMVKYKEMGFSIEGLSQENCLLVAGNPE